MSLPSVLLHDHLDGGLRPSTVLDLADTFGYDGLPHSDETKLAAWFDQSESGSLERYLEAFQHTTVVMQHRNAIERIAYEAAVDLAADGVVYAEIRFNPPQHIAGGLGMADVVAAWGSALAMGERETGMKWSLTIGSLRHLSLSMELARLAVFERDRGVTAFDLAGPEAGNPPRDHVAACRLIRESGLRLTIHSGEAAGARGPLTSLNRWMSVGQNVLATGSRS
jgi:adenosine deaminase